MSFNYFFEITSPFHTERDSGTMALPYKKGKMSCP